MDREHAINIRGPYIFYVQVQMTSLKLNAITRCTCSKGFMGADCSLRTCPRDFSWSDQATATDVAHALEECSGRGLCDRGLGNWLVDDFELRTSIYDTYTFLLFFGKAFVSV